jgi:hypothetical protein
MEDTVQVIPKKPKSNENENKSQKISVCEIMKTNTSDIIQKLEVEMPILFQNYSDLYSRYLHSIQDLFGVCNLAEEKYFDKMQIDQNFLKAVDQYWKFMANITESQIDLTTNFLKSYIPFRLSVIDSWDQYVHTLTNTYAKTLSQFIQD